MSLAFFEARIQATSRTIARTSGIKIARTGRHIHDEEYKQWLRDNGVEPTNKIQDECRTGLALETTKRKGPEDTMSGANAGRSNMEGNVTYDKNKWNALVKYDEEIALTVDKLTPLGQRWVDEFASSYLTRLRLRPPRCRAKIRELIVIHRRWTPVEPAGTMPWS
jgi:hypothetical protein